MNVKGLERDVRGLEIMCAENQTCKGGKQCIG